MKNIYYKYNIFYLSITLLFVVNVVLIIFIYQNRGCNRYENKVVFLDIGQGDAIYIENKLGQNILIDTGNKDSGVLKQIQKARLCYKVSIDHLILTHPDQDHIGEATRLIRKGLVKNIIHNGFLDMDQQKESLTENDLEDIIKFKNIKTQNMVLNPVLGIQDFSIRFLYPFEKPYQDRKGKSKSVDDNDYSIVLKLSYANTSFMLTGDAPIKVEKEIIDKNCTDVCPILKSDVLKLGHHGSKNSSGIDFLSKVDAAEYIVSAGKDNRYNHPDEETIFRINLNKKDSLIRETYFEGNIIYLLD